MATAGRGEDPEDVILRKARAVVQDALRSGWSGPPFCPEVLVSLQGITLQKTSEAIGADARIFPKADGTLLIEYDPSRPQRRVNFSICHELVHTFFEDCYETVRYRNNRRPEEWRHLELEYLCDLGAAELLLPFEHFSRDLEKRGISLHSVCQLRDEYGASTEAVLIRIAQLSEVACAVVFLSEKFKPTEKKAQQTAEFDFGLPSPKPKLRVDCVCPSTSFRLFIPQDKSIQDDSAGYKALAPDEIFEAEEKWDLPNFGTRRVQAVALPQYSGLPRRVVALVF